MPSPSCVRCWHLRHRHCHRLRQRRHAGNRWRDLVSSQALVLRSVQTSFFLFFLPLPSPSRVRCWHPRHRHRLRHCHRLRQHRHAGSHWRDPVSSQALVLHSVRTSLFLFFSPVRSPSPVHRCHPRRCCYWLLTCSVCSQTRRRSIVAVCGWLILA